MSLSQRHRRRPARLLAKPVLSAALSAAVLCGAVGAVVLPASAATAAVPATAPAPWAKAVCGGLDSWVNAVNAASAKAAAKPATTAAATKKTLNAFLARVLSETAKVRARLAKAGKPDVAGGKQIAATTREGFRQVASSVKGAKQSLAATSTTDAAAFTAAVRSAQDAVESGLESIQAAFSAARNADAGPLLAAFNDQPACQAVAG